MFDLTEFAERELAYATEEYEEKAATDGLDAPHRHKIEPRIYFVKLPEGLVTNVANYPELNPTIKRFFNSTEGKTALGRWLSVMIGSGLIDAVVLVIEAFALVLDKGETYDERVPVRDDPRRREMILAEIITKDSARAISQGLRGGRREGEPVRLGFDTAHVALSRFAPHLEERPDGATLQ